MMDLDKIKQLFSSALLASTSEKDLDQVKIKFLGRNGGLITSAFLDLAKLEIEQKREFGPKLNFLKIELEQALEKKQQSFIKKNILVDFTLPPENTFIGHLHPLTQIQKQLEDIFSALGFITVTGPDVESDWYNFTALNFPENHPARDMQDTFFIKSGNKEKLVMRTHTSPNQVRFMQKHKPPFAIIVPGKVYRNEATDATHEHTFDQLEGLVVGEKINFANMVWAIDYVFKEIFGKDTKIKVLPTFFPFVEPGAEIAMSSPHFKNGQWVEMAGCGMVHQKVFEFSGYKKNKYQGFAFGFGSVRFPLMKHGITDIRLLHENNLQFLNQF